VIYRLVFTQYGCKETTEAVLYKLIKNYGILYVSSYYYDPMHEGMLRTDEEHYRAVKKLIADIDDVKIEIPAHAASFICCFQRHGYEVIPY